MAINLLPTEFAPSARIARIANLVRNLVFVGLIVFILSTAAMVALFLFDSFSVRQSVARQEVTTGIIKSLETTELRFVLIQDRLSKAKTIVSEAGVGNALSKLKDLLPIISGGASLSGAEITLDKTKFSVTAANSSDLANFLATLVSGNYYKKIDLTSFSFSPTGGYLVSLEAFIK